MLYTRDLHNLAFSPLTSEYNPDDDDDEEEEDDDDDDDDEDEDEDEDDDDDDDDDAVSFHGSAQLMCWKEHIYSKRI